MGTLCAFIPEPLICIYGSVWQGPSLGRAHAPATAEDMEGRSAYLEMCETRVRL